jgi:hypothetical protein
MIPAIYAWFIAFMGAVKLPLIGISILTGIKRMMQLGPIGVVWVTVLIICIDIITPPYLLGTESLIAGAIASVFALLGFSFASVFMLALILIYIFATLFVIVSFLSLAFF